MSESRWTYYDPLQGTQTLGLYHGQDSGNVVIYHNSHVVLVDFMVHQTKSYSFMVNEHLFNLKVEKDNDRFDYLFEAEHIKETAISASDKVKSFFKWPFSQLVA